jgi:hypothetical protein
MERTLSVLTNVIIVVDLLLIVEPLRMRGPIIHHDVHLPLNGTVVQQSRSPIFVDQHSQTLVLALQLSPQSSTMKSTPTKTTPKKQKKMSASPCPTTSYVIVVALISKKWRNLPGK